MEIILNEITNVLDLSKYDLDDKSCFLDIETTGLSRNKNIVYLIGIIYYNLNSNSWVLKQIFANKINKEADILLKTIKLLNKYSTIINYNGSAFDIPFLNARLKYHNIDYYIEKEKSFDIYKIVRSEKDILNLKNLKLETLEKYMGIQRQDIYSGKECIKLYYDYLENMDLSLQEDILRHNREDLVYMLEIMPILDLIRDKKTFIISKSNLDYEFYIEEMYFDNNFLIIKGMIHGNFNNVLMHYDMDYSIELNNDRFSIRLETNKGLIDSNKSAQFIDLSNYNGMNQILVLSIEKTYSMENIKKLLKIIIEKTI